MGKTALLIIDMQNDFCLPGAPFEVKGALSVAAQIKKALDAGRSFGLPIVHVIRHYRADGTDVEITRLQAFMEKGGALIEGTKGAEIIDGLKPVKGEYIVVKKRWSAFFQTELDILLRRLKVNRIVVTGVQTPNLYGQLYDANPGHEVILLTDGTGNGAEVHQANLFDMQNIGIELMTTEEFITYLHNLPK